MPILSGDPYFSPLVAEDLSELPPAYVVACEYDTLRDENLQYVERLREAGVKTHLNFVKGGWHGIALKFPNAKLKRGDEISQEMAEFILDNV